MTTEDIALKRSYWWFMHMQLIIYIAYRVKIIYGNVLAYAVRRRNI